MLKDCRDKRIHQKINGEDLIIGISPEQELDALNAIEYWRDAQANNFADKSKEYINYCHQQIVKIQNYIDRNTF